MKLNIGAGFTYLEGFTNVDVCKEYKVAWFPFKRLLYRISGTRKHHSYEAFHRVLKSKPIHHDVRKPLPFENESIEEIYTSHLLEHLVYADGCKFLRECMRVLKRGGVLRIVTPDFDIVDKDVLFNEFTDELSRHKWVWSFDEIRRVFIFAMKLPRHSGKSSALALDSMPEQSMYVEVHK